MALLKQIELLEPETDGICLLDLPSDTCDDVLAAVDEDTTIVSNTETETESESDTLHTVTIPDVFGTLDSRVHFVLEILREREVFDAGDDVLVVANLPSADSPVVGKVAVPSEYMDDGIRALFFESEPSVETIQHVLEVAMTLSQTGQKGDPVGALFVIGDEDEVMDRSRPLNHNPFAGADVSIDDDVSVSIGEFAKLDGAFVISGTGRVVSASRYLEPRVHDAEVPSGLGARHMAASGISKATDAVSIVVSESDRKVRCFVDGEIVVSGRPTDIEL